MASKKMTPVDRPDAHLLGNEALAVLEEIESLRDVNLEQELSRIEFYLDSELASRNSRFKAYLFSRKAGNLGSRKDPGTEEAILEAIKYSKESNSQFVCGGALYGYARFLHYSGDVKKIYSLLMEAFDTFVSIGANAWAGKCLLSLAIHYIDWGNFEQAPELALKGRQLLENSPYDADRAELYTNLALFYGRLGIYDLSIENYRQAMPFVATESILNKVIIPYNFAMALARSDLGAAPVRAEELDEGEKILHQTLQLSEQAQYSYGLLLSRFGLAVINKKKGKFDEARKDYTLILSLAIELKDSHFISNITYELAILAIKLGEVEEAHKLALEVLKLAEEANFLSRRADAHDLLHQIAAARGDFRSALEEYKLYQQLNLEFHQSEIAQVKTQAETRLELKNIEMRTEAQKLRTEQLEKELSNTTLQLVAHTNRLAEFRDSIREIAAKMPPSEATVRELRAMVKELTANATDWKKYDEQFKAAYPEFIAKLTEKYPALSVTELRVCALLRMNLKSEDIARLFCLSERTIENHRNHIRQKMKLRREEELAIVLAKL